MSNEILSSFGAWFDTQTDDEKFQNWTVQERAYRAGAEWMRAQCVLLVTHSDNSNPNTPMTRDIGRVKFLLERIAIKIRELGDAHE